MSETCDVCGRLVLDGKVADEERVRRVRTRASRNGEIRRVSNGSLRLALDRVTHVVGCQDNSCMFVRPAGMATNGGCRCLPRDGGGRPFVARSLAMLYKAVQAHLDGEAT